MNERGVVIIGGVALVLFGILGLVVDNNDFVQTPAPIESDGSSLQVKEATQNPQPTIDQLQGTGGVQSGGGQVQNGNAGSSLQPNAGSTSLPAGY